jgi:2-oxoglutarate ferredoxin oxidoreductase subunit alpha
MGNGMNIEKVRVSRFELLMDAGFGAQKAGDILVNAFAHTGRSVYVEPMIPAEISPPARSVAALSGVVIRVADFDLKNLGSGSDVILASHEILISRRLEDREFKPNCKVLLDMRFQKNNEATYEKALKAIEELGLTLIPVAISEDADKAIKALKGKGLNMYYLGILSRIYHISQKEMHTEIDREFAKKLDPEILQKNRDIFDRGYDYAAGEIHFGFEVPTMGRMEGEHILIDGNTALAMGIIDAGFKLYAGYPITPASSIMHTLAREFPKYGGIVHQAEDEISAIGAAIGSYFAGVPAITGTSGPGLSLKQEFISYACAAEAPIVIIDVQRAGPSTGMPTKTEQSDLPSVIFGSHGDHTCVVISVGNVHDCYLAPKMARYLTEKLRVPVFIMSDFMMANSYKIIKKPPVDAIDHIDELKDYLFAHFFMDRLPDQIEMVRAFPENPGVPGKMRRMTGLNTDDKGSPNYTPYFNERSHTIRNEKIHHVQRALKCPKLFGSVQEGDILVVGWGTTRGVIAEAVHNCQEQGLKVGGMCFRIVYPLPLNLKEVFERFKRVVTVEMAFGDQLKRTPLAMFLRSKTLIDIDPMLSRVTGRPFEPRALENKIKEILSTLKNKDVKHRSEDYNPLFHKNNFKAL